jgi:hypothetical protein
MEKENFIQVAVELQKQEEQRLLYEFKKNADPSLFSQLTVLGHRVGVKIHHKKGQVFLNNEIKGFDVLSIMVEKKVTTVIYRKKKDKRKHLAKRLRKRSTQQVEVTSFSFDSLREDSVSFPAHFAEDDLEWAFPNKNSRHV